MKTAKEFDYDLWTTEEAGGKRYWTRVKATGEVSEVSHGVMKFLRCEEKRMRREVEAAQGRGGPDLRLDTLTDGEAGESWLRTSICFEDGVIARQDIKEFRRLLTPVQRSVFDECFVAGKSRTEYAAAHGLAVSSVSRSAGLIKNKANIFWGICKKD